MFMNLIALFHFYSDIGETIFTYYNQSGRPILDVMHFVFDKMFYFFLFFAVILSCMYFYMSVYGLLHRKVQAEKKFNEKKAPFVTVQIPTFNELAAIRCAKKCLEFDYPTGKFEVIIGDDSDDSYVSSRIDEFARLNPEVKVTRRGTNKGFKAGNLNNMLKHSNGEILVIFDSDFLPERDFLKRIIAPFIHDSTISAVQARWEFIDKNKNMVSTLGSTIIDVFHHICLPFINRHAGISFLCGSAEAVKKKDLIALGCWQTGSLTEDIEFSLRIIKTGKKIIYLEGLKCLGEVPSKPKDLYRQQMRWAYGVISGFKKHYKSLILFNGKVGVKQKFYTFMFCSGYMLSFLLVILFTTGTLSFITHSPAPIDIGKFLSEMAVNVALTSGIIIASTIAMIKTGNIKKLFAMILASFTFGLVVTYYVNVGILKVLFNKPMRWYMLNKSGNSEQYAQ